MSEFNIIVHGKNKNYGSVTVLRNYTGYDAKLHIIKHFNLSKNTKIALKYNDIDILNKQPLYTLTKNERISLSEFNNCVFPVIYAIVNNE